MVPLEPNRGHIVSAACSLRVSTSATAVSRSSKEYGLATIFISHDLATVRFMAHEVIVMYLGRVVEYRPAKTICSAPVHPYTRALLAAALPPDPDAPPA